jgi:ribosomal protein S18 acetylase RimI-like enzyme
MEDVYIRRTTLIDLPELHLISRQTFLETFSKANTEENMRMYLEEAFSLKKLTDELNSDNSEFYFAVLEDTIVGYVKINLGTSQTELMDAKALEIERIYVLRQYHRRNIGQLLYEKAIEIARRMDATYVWLGVWEENARAIKFYRKNGFVEFDKHIFRLGKDEQTDETAIEGIT